MTTVVGMNKPIQDKLLTGLENFITQKCSILEKTAALFLMAMEYL